MAARTRKGTKDQPWTDKTRERIQASMLVNRLVDHVLGTNDVELSTSQVTAALGLMKKILPDMQSIETTVEDVTEKRWIGEMPTAEEFEQKHLSKPDASELN